jgi:predicted ArsR family transcriptional regulator
VTADATTAMAVSQEVREMAKHEQGTKTREDGPVDELQQEARALGDPTRHRIFRYIADAIEPVSVAELTAFVQLNHNAVRQHLAVLKKAHLVIEEVEARSVPGRPRLLYRLHPETFERWSTTGAYSWLAGMLSDAVRTGQPPRDVGRQEGKRRALELASPAPADALFESELERRGFRPVRHDKGRRVELVLERCPFAEVAAADPDTICELHLGLAEGLAEGLGDLEVERLVRKNPRSAGCRLVVRRTKAAHGAPR